MQDIQKCRDFAIKALFENMHLQYNAFSYKKMIFDMDQYPVQNVSKKANSSTDIVQRDQFGSN